MTYSFELQFRDFSKDALRVYDGIAQIYVKKSPPDEKGHVFVTHECVSMSEFEHEIERLKQELDDLKKKAKQKFAKEH